MKLVFFIETLPGSRFHKQLTLEIIDRNLDCKLTSFLLLEPILFIVTVSRLRIQKSFMSIMRICFVLGLSLRKVSTRVGKFCTKSGFGIIIKITVIT